MEAIDVSPVPTIVHLEAGRHLYGGALQVKYLLEGLKAFPINNILICPKGAAIADACRESLSGAVEIIECDMNGDLDWRLSARVQRILRAKKASLLHIHSRRGADIWGARAAIKENVPSILTRRVDNREPRWLTHWKYHKLYKRVVTISDGVKQVLVESGVDPLKMETIHSVVDTDLFQTNSDRPWFEKTFGFTPQDRVIAVVAQLIERKGHRILFDAIEPILSRFPAIKLMVLGQGPERKALEAIVQNRALRQNVQFWGFRDDIHKILPNIEFVVHPAFSEGMGVSLLQASACGVPVIASRVGGIPEAVSDGEHGMLIEPGNALKLQEAIENLLSNDTLRKRFSQKARQRMVEQFSLQSMSEKYFRLYQNLLFG